MTPDCWVTAEKVLVPRVEKYGTSSPAAKKPCKLENLTSPEAWKFCAVAELVSETKNKPTNVHSNFCIGKSLVEAKQMKPIDPFAKSAIDAGFTSNAFRLHGAEIVLAVNH